MEVAREQLVISCVVDADPVFAYQAWHLGHSLVERAGISAQQFKLQCTPGVSAEARGELAKAGFGICMLTPFADGKFCNKLAQWPGLSGTAARTAVLLDTDMMCLASFNEVLSGHAAVGKPVDLPNPPLAVLDALFAQAGQQTRPPQVRVDAQSQMTFAGNFNGGFYGLPTSVAPRLFPVWQRWAEWLLSDACMLSSSGYRRNADQIAFCLAAHELGLNLRLAPTNLNYFVHFEAPRHYFKASQPIAMLHYHAPLLDLAGRLSPVGPLSPQSLAAVADANDLIERQQNPVLQNMLSTSTILKTSSRVGLAALTEETDQAALTR